MPDGDLPAFEIASSNQAGSVTATDVYRSLLEYSKTVMNWYLLEKEKKALASKVLGVASIVFFSAGAIIPLLSSVTPSVNASYGYVFLAVGGTLQLVDRYRGYSKSWARYVSSAMHINSSLLALQVEWSRMSQAETPGDQDRWELLKKYAAELGLSISSETERWSDLLESEAESLSTKLPVGKLDGGSER